jgi:transcription initiation factor TFIIIB Brf1 subunit/transcription initiation factor TFIIB
MVNILKNEEDAATSDEVYSVSHTYEHRTQEDIAPATGIIGVAPRNRFNKLTEKLELN